MFLYVYLHTYILRFLPNEEKTLHAIRFILWYFLRALFSLTENQFLHTQ